MQSSVEFCVVTYKNSETLSRLMESIAEQVQCCAVAVHDNGPGGRDAHCAERLGRRLGLNVRTQTCAENCGFARGCNALAASSGADWLIFLNPDAWILRWDESMLVGMGGIVGANIMGPECRQVNSWGVSRTMWEEIRRKWFRGLVKYSDRVGYVSGAAMACRRSDFEALAGFDPNYFMYYEDIDLCHRAVGLGISVSRNPQWIVAHTGGFSAQSKGAEALWWSYVSGRYFHAKVGHSTRWFYYITLADAHMHVIYYRVTGKPEARRKWRCFASALRGGETAR